MTATKGNILVCSAALVVLTLAVYANSLHAPFLFDDLDSITGNPTIRSLHPLSGVLAPIHGGQSVAGRPFLNLTLAVNYAWSGTDPWSYHLVNLGVHLLAGLTLFGIVRRTWPRWLKAKSGSGGEALAHSSKPSPEAGRDEPAALLPAFAVALLWTLHPLQTESVTYVIQRAESMAGLFYLLTLYCFIRGATDGSPLAWFSGAVTACFLGMATKEIVVSAPLLVMLYDRTFLSGSFRLAWRRHWRVYSGLIAGWLLLASLVAGSGWNRGGSIGFGANAGWWNHLLTQFPALAHYLYLSFWPHPLVFEYGIEWVDRIAPILPAIVVVVGLIWTTIIGLRRASPLGFLGAGFLAILAPTSLLPAGSQMTVEHRMYLPLAAIITGAVATCFARWGRKSALGLVVLGLGLGLLTARRNADYHSAITIWTDTVAKRPDNALAHSSLAGALASAGQREDAVAHYEESLRLQPKQPEAHNNLGSLLVAMERPTEAVEHLRRALDGNPSYVAAHINLGNALLDMNRTSEAMAEFETALRLQPDHPGAHYNLGNALASIGRLPEAIIHYQAALQQDPQNAEVHDNFGSALAQSGRLEEAIRQYKMALQLDASSAETHNNLGNALLLSGRALEAIQEYETALRIRPGYGEAQDHLALARRQAGENPGKP
jgi:tetratricopeptide (TPR) repeat protein